MEESPRIIKWEVKEAAEVLLMTHTCPRWSRHLFYFWFVKRQTDGIEILEFSPTLIPEHFMKRMNGPDHVEVCFSHPTFRVPGAAKLTPVCRDNSCCCRSSGQIVKFDSLVENKWRQMPPPLLVSSRLNGRG